jgi:hypothetical protein
MLRGAVSESGAGWWGLQKVGCQVEAATRPAGTPRSPNRGVNRTPRNAPARQRRDANQQRLTNLGQHPRWEIRWSGSRSDAYLGSHALRDC